MKVMYTDQLLVPLLTEFVDHYLLLIPASKQPFIAATVCVPEVTLTDVSIATV